MKRGRKNPYYFLNTACQIKTAVDNKSGLDDARHLIGNYFTSEDKAREAQKRALKAFEFNNTLLNRLKLSSLKI